MPDRLLPPRIDNTYRGHWLALWLFGALLVVKGGIALGTIFNGYSAATSADGIPLDTFAPVARQAFISLFAAWGLAQLMLNLIGLLALLRYRAMVPLMFSVLLAEHLARKLVFVELPMPRAGAASGFWINVLLVGAMIIGLLLALWHPSSQAKESP
jgi:hypothetical protein